MRLGKTARMWRDDKLNGNDIFADEIVGQFETTAVLVSILTPRYLASPWCLKEFHEFCARAEQNGGLIVDNKARIFKILKTPVETPPCVVSRASSMYRAHRTVCDHRRHDSDRHRASDHYPCLTVLLPFSNFLHE